jgi:hypothetical protein
MENSMKAPQKPKNRTAIKSSNSYIIGIYLKGCRSCYNKDTCTPMFVAALFIIAKLWKQPRMPSN